MHILVTSASGANGDGYGSLLSFGLDGTPMRAFSNDARIFDPRGLGVSADRRHLYVNTGRDRILSLDREGNVVRDTGPVPGLNAGGGHLRPDGRYCVGAAPPVIATQIIASRSWRSSAKATHSGSPCSLRHSKPSEHEF